MRAKSALGLKYLEIRQGTSEESFAAGATIPLSPPKPEPVDIDQVLNIFDEPTRLAIQQNLVEFGNALAGRGIQLNAAIGGLAAAAAARERDANLAGPSTGLGRFFKALSDTAAEVAPVAEEQAQMFVSLDTTFAAFADVARPFIQETISESAADPRRRHPHPAAPAPLPRHSAALFADLQPGSRGASRRMRRRSPRRSRPAPRCCDDSPSFNGSSPPARQALLDFSHDPGVTDGIDRLTETIDILTPTLDSSPPRRRSATTARSRSATSRA